MARITRRILANWFRLAMTAPIAAEKGPPRAAPYPALEKVAAVFKDFRWEMVLEPTSIASSSPERSVSITKSDPFLEE